MHAFEPQFYSSVHLLVPFCLPRMSISLLRSSMMLRMLRTRQEKFRLTTSIKRHIVASPFSNEDLLIQTLLKQSANNTKPLPRESTAVVRSAVLKLLARKEYITVTRAIEMVYEIRNGSTLQATSLFRPALHCCDSLHAGMIAYGKLRKPNKSRQLVQRLQKEGMWPIEASPGGAGVGPGPVHNNNTVTTSQSSLSSTQSTVSFLLQAYCDADRLDLAEDLFMQWLLLSRGSGGIGSGSSSGGGSGSSSGGSGKITTAATLKSPSSAANDAALDAIVEYLTSYRKIMTAPTSTHNHAFSSGLTAPAAVPPPPPPPSASAVTSLGNSEGIDGISNNNDSSTNSNNSLYSGSIDISTLLVPSSGSCSTNNSRVDIPTPMWLSLLRLYADRGDTPLFVIHPFHTLHHRQSICGRHDVSFSYSLIHKHHH